MDKNGNIFACFSEVCESDYDILWISFQEKDTVSINYEYGAYGCGYQNNISESCMPLFAEIYRSAFCDKLFEVVLFESKMNKPCLITQKKGLENRILRNDADNVTIEYINIECIDLFWKKILTNQTEDIIHDIIEVVEHSLNCRIPKSFDYERISFKDLIIPEKFRLLTKSIKLLIDIIMNEVDIVVHSNIFLKEAKGLIVGSLFYPWKSLIYDDFQKVLGDRESIEGGITISSKCTYSSINDALQKFSHHIMKIKLAVLGKIWQDNLEFRKILAIKSAKAAIMSRNMSHNLGSHVMFYIKQRLLSVSKIVDSDVLKNIIPGDISSIEEVIKKVKENKGIELPFLVGLGKFINYLQERQDYIATIATDYIPANSTISFKDFIYDELKPDLRYKRHHPKEKIEDVSDDSGTEPGNLLLDYIAYSEGYTSSDMIEIKFGEFDGEKPKKGTQAYADFEELRKFNIAVPGGVVGRQAIFSIIENIIRNAAKHSGRRSDGRLAILFTILDDKALSKILVRIKMKNSKWELRCNRSEPSEREYGERLIEKYKTCTNDYHILCIKLDMPNNKKAIDDLVKKLGEDYVNPDGVMKDSSKGLKEMRISAAWLRGCSIDTKIDDKEPPVLSVLSEPMDNSDHYTLAYILCIPKPRKIAFIVDDEMLNGHQSEYNTLCTHIRPYGCDIFKVSDMLSSTLCKVPNYDIVCLCTDEKREDIICKISSRYISNKDIALTQLDALYDFIVSNSKKQDLSQKYIIELDKKIDSIYEVWFDEWYKKAYLKDKIFGEKHRLVILDAKAIEKKKDESDVVEEGLVTLTTTGKSRTEDCENAVIYSTHFKGLKDEDNCSKFINAASVESVTGNNSTDRLIRQDEWTKEWMSKHLAAGLSKVAIFDERIFSTFIQCSGIDEKSIDSCLSEFFNKPIEQHTNSNLIQLIKKRFSLEFKVAKEIVNSANGNQDELKRQIMNYNPRHYNTDIAQINHERRIWAYDIRCFEDKDEPRVDIVGYTAPIRNNVGAYNEDNTIDERIASIVKVKDDDKYKVEIYSSQVFAGKNGQVFDYITIHQGILDKIYTTFGIKTNQSEMFKITNALHKAFSKHATPDDLKKFLPNFIIHSGRSKPNFVDMPQQQPFVQFAAIEQAVKDCKYTLVELLITAHYENSGNN